MAKAYEYIAKYEKTLDDFSKKVEELQETLNFFEEHHLDFQGLMDYYQSEIYQEDLKDDEEGKIPQNVKRGILSQDAIYDLYSDYRQVSLKMLELGTNFFKGE